MQRCKPVLDQTPHASCSPAAEPDLHVNAGFTTHMPTRSLCVITHQRAQPHIHLHTQGMQRVRLRRPLLFHGCSSAPGSRVVLDFSELQVRYTVCSCRSWEKVRCLRAVGACLLACLMWIAPGGAWAVFQHKALDVAATPVCCPTYKHFWNPRCGAANPCLIV